MTARRSAFLAVLLAVVLPAAARAERFEDVDVAPLPVETVQTHFGYLEQRFRVVNQSSQTRTVSIELRALHGGGAALSALRRTVVVGPGAGATVSLFKPALDGYGFETVIRLNGRRVGTLSDRLPLHQHTRGGSYRGQHVTVLISRRFNPTLFEEQFKEKFYRASEEASSPHQQPAAFVRAEQDVNAWSGHWLGYSRFAGIVVTDADYAGAPDDVRDALRRYVEAGGSLWIAGPGAGASDPTAAPGAPRLRREFIGFGLRWTGPDPQTNPYSAENTAALAEDWLRVRRAGEQRVSADVIPPPLLPVENSGLPIGMILLLMIGFALVIGPANLIVAHQRRRPLQLLWTTPLLALVMTGALFAYGMFSEGVTPHTRARAFTLLDQDARRAVSFGLLSWYTPLSPGDGLRFGFDTEISPILARRESGGSRVMDWTRDQHLSSGWLPARTATAFLVRKVEPRRERIALTRDGDRLRIVNGLGADIEALWLADRDGRLHQVRGVPAGGESALTPLAANLPRAGGGPETFMGMPQSDWLAAWQEWERMPSKALRPGSYLAVLTDSPFVETGLAGKQVADRRAWVVGLLAPEDLP